MSTRILLADDHTIVREGLKHLLAKEPDLEVIAEADNGRKAVHLARTVSPDIVVMDLSMPEMSGIEAMRELTALGLGIPVLALSMHSEKRFVVEALNAGAKGYLLKDCAFDELIVAIRSVISGRNYLSPGITGVIIDDYLTRLPDAVMSPLQALSPREQEVLARIADGGNTKEIAFALGISIKTVEAHRQQIMKKLAIFSVAELTKFAIREGLTGVE